MTHFGLRAWLLRPIICTLEKIMSNSEELVQRLDALVPIVSTIHGDVTELKTLIEGMGGEDPNIAIALERVTSLEASLRSVDELVPEPPVVEEGGEG